MIPFSSIAQLPGNPSEPTKPLPRNDSRWLRLFNSQKAQLAGKIDLCLVGDSLTEFWSETGRPILDLEFQGKRIANLGTAADRTEHILYRVDQLDFTRAKPDLIVVLAGTNNLAKDPSDSPEGTARGVQAIVDSLRLKSEESRILLLSILPSGYTPDSPLRKRILKTNRLLEEISGVEFLDVHGAFVDETGKWKSGLTLDGTHLSLQGYDILGRRISQRIRNPKPLE